mmetsp:Transcript_29978/g.61877  ORF Transcript_29978/g.61877 Transcript_29978/m.61877 type:complete len:204 (-) Transcript_29978:158-769(-)
MLAGIGPAAVVLLPGRGLPTRLAMQLIVLPLSDGLGTIGPSILAAAVLRTLFEGSTVAGRVGPRFLTVTVWLIRSPLACIGGTIRIAVDAETMGLVVPPLAVVHCTIGVKKHAHTTRHVVAPAAFVPRPIFPNLDPSTVALRSHPLTVVGSTGLKHVLPFVKKILPRVGKFTDLLCLPQPIVGPVGGTLKSRLKALGAWRSRP